MAPEGESYKSKAEKTLIRITDARCTLFLYHSSNTLMSFCFSPSHNEFEFIGNDKIFSSKVLTNMCLKHVSM